MQKVKFNSEWDFWKEGQEVKKRRIDLPHDAMLEEQRDPALFQGKCHRLLSGREILLLQDHSCRYIL